MISPVFLIATFWEAFILIFVFVPLVLLWVFALVDLFVRKDLWGWAKVLWLFLILILPILGVVIYFLVPPPEEVQVTMSRPGAADQLEKLAQLRDAGVISEEEFAKEKAKLLS